MAQTEGEKEIVLGNKQLVSLFFVVVALLGVFFAAGYMIGRKSVSPLPATANNATTSEGTLPRQPEVETVREASPAPETSGGKDAQTAPPTDTMPSPEKPPRELRQVHIPKPERPAEIVVSKPEAGATYLQVTALRHPEADNLVRSLQEQNFPASLAPSSVGTLFRVLVGPYHETSKLADAKAKLKALGFANAFVQK